MRVSTAIATAAAALSLSAAAAPVNMTGSSTAPTIPSDAIHGFLDLSEAEGLGLVPVNKGNVSGILFVNNTMINEYYETTASLNEKRDADAKKKSPWHWLTFDIGEPLYGKRDAEAKKKSPWHWLTFDIGEPLYGKRDADANADAKKKSPWHWLTFDIGEPLYG